MNRLFVLAGTMLVVLLTVTRAQAQNDQYYQIYSKIEQADSLNSAGELHDALSEYKAAQSALEHFKEIYPGWNTNVVSYRLHYIAAKVAALSKKVPVQSGAASKRAHAPHVAPAKSFQPSATNTLKEQLNVLQRQVQRLRADNADLESKLKEALSAQPAAVDPRELAKARAEIRTLAKKNGLLEVSLSQQKQKSPEANESQNLAPLKQALAQAQQQAAAATQQAKTLAGERQALLQKLKARHPSSLGTSNLSSSPSALAQVNRKLTEQTQRIVRLAREKSSLQARVKTLESAATAAQALRAENAVLKQRLGKTNSAPGSSESAELAQQLADTRAKVAQLESDRTTWRLQKRVLEHRIQILSESTNAAPSATDSANGSQVKQLERTQAELRQKLAAAENELNTHPDQTEAASIRNLRKQLETLRVRLAVFEAQKVPYTKAELALLKAPHPALATAHSEPNRSSLTKIPAGASALAAEAQREFAAKHFAQAEAKYETILKQHPNNVYTLANLAAIELQRGRLGQAEDHVKKALSLAPDDAFSLLIQGQIEFRRKQYDQALRVLSRAAHLDPKNPVVENFLGLTLSEKGLREPAETALRKAILLDPHYGAAQNNLAVIYLTQKPPLVALARWHYQKALDAGFPPNPQLEKMLKQAEQPANTQKRGTGTKTSASNQ